MSNIPQLQDVPEISFIDFLSFEDLRADMFEDYQREYLRLTNEWDSLPDASPMRLILLSTASKIYHAMQCVDRAGKASMLKYSTGGDLDNLAALYGIKRRQPRGARVTLEFSMTSIRASATPIPGGTRVRSVTGKCFYTSSYAEIPVGEPSVKVQATAEETGESSNGIAIGELNSIVDPVPYVAAVTNTSVSAGGDSLQNDDDLTLAVWNAPARYSTAGAVESYEYWIRQFGGGIETFKAYSPAPSHDTVLVLLEGGVQPDQEFLNALYEYLSDHNKRPLADRLLVTTPHEVPYDINLTYYISRDKVSQEYETQQKVEQAIDEYIKRQREIGLDIIPDMLIGLIRKAGGKRSAVISPAHTVIPPNQIAKLNSRTVNYGGLEDA